MIKKKNKLFYLLALLMACVIVLSNYLVQFPIKYFSLNNLLTYGALSYPIAFLITDLSNRRYGKNTAKKIVYLGFALGVFITLYFSTNYSDLISIRIAIGSGTAFLVAQLIDVNIFDKLRDKIWFAAPLTSSLIGSTIDTFLFFSISFYGTGINWISLSLGDLMVKFFISLLMLIPFKLLLETIKDNIYNLEGFENIDVHHHMGGTRMGINKFDSVVNKDLKVHGVNNLYVSGSSNFVTSGYTNPTFTIIQLAIRLAKEINKRLKNTKQIEDDYLDTLQNNRSRPRIPFGSLVELGIIKPGTEIFDQKKKINAKIMVDGSIKYQKSEGSIHKIAAQILGAESCNGWTYWYYQSGNNLKPIDNLRQKLRPNT